MDFNQFKQEDACLPLKRTITFRCSDPMWRELYMMASNKGSDFSTVIRYLCTEGMRSLSK